MSDEINQIPDITPPEELPHAPEFLRKEKWFDIDIEKDFLNFAEPYRPPRYTLARNGVPFANVGELHIITGKPGNGKTGLMSQLMATILSGKFGNTEYILTERPEPIVLYIDTEQGKDDTIAVKNRVCSLADIDYDKPQKQFVVLRLRDTEDAKDRWRKILKAIYIVQPTDIFLDGLLDIVKDYNDQVECQPIVRECMMAATHFDASLWAVLHENPLVDKLVGTLGSIAQRKVAEIFTVKKIKQCDMKPTERRLDRPNIYFQVKQVKARGRDVEDWDFQYVTNTGGWGQPVELGTIEEESEDKKAIRESVEIFQDVSWSHTGVTYSELCNHLTKKGFTNDNKRKKAINTALDCEVIRSEGKQGHRKFYYNGYKESPEDTSQAIPFEPNNSNEEAPY
jgi:hypothetical protein